MPGMSMRQMLEAGVHFGHQTRFWNPKMAPFIFGERNRIHIINLEHSLPLLQRGGGVRAQSSSPTAARCCSWAPSAPRAKRSRPEASAAACPTSATAGSAACSPTSRPSASRSVASMEIDEMAANGTLDHRSKREAQGLRREREKLDRSLGGIKDMDGLPDAMFVIDVGHEKIAIHEAQKLGIPVVAVVDTNCSPDGISYVIPGNDDAMRAIQLYAAGMADAVIEGRSTIVEVPVGEDEFVELDEEGKPRARTGAPKPPSAWRPGPQEDGRSPRAASRRRRRRCRRAARRGAGRGRSGGERRGVHGPPRSRAQEGRPRAAARLLPAAPRRCRRACGRRARRAGTRHHRGRLIMAVTAEAVKALRERTGAGMMECKKALVETNGDLEAAAEIMRKSGLAKADKKAEPRGRRRRDRHRAIGRRQAGRGGRGQLGDGLRRARGGLPGLRRRRRQGCARAQAGRSRGAARRQARLRARRSRKRAAS